MNISLRMSDAHEERVWDVKQSCANNATDMQLKRILVWACEAACFQKPEDALKYIK